MQTEFILFCRHLLTVGECGHLVNELDFFHIFNVYHILNKDKTEQDLAALEQAQRRRDNGRKAFIVSL